MKAQQHKDAFSGLDPLCAVLGPPVSAVSATVDCSRFFLLDNCTGGRSILNHRDSRAATAQRHADETGWLRGRQCQRVRGRLGQAAARLFLRFRTPEAFPPSTLELQAWASDLNSPRAFFAECLEKLRSLRGHSQKRGASSCSNGCPRRKNFQGDA